MTSLIARPYGREETALQPNHRSEKQGRYEQSVSGIATGFNCPAMLACKSRTIGKIGPKTRRRLFLRDVILAVMYF